MKELPPLHGTYYRVVDWDGTFENAASRELQTLSWVGAPVGLISIRPFRYLSRMANAEILAGKFGDTPGDLTLMATAEAVWGVYMAVVLASSQTPKPHRGLLLDMHGPVSAEDFAVHTGFTTEVVQASFDTLCSQKIGWLESITFVNGVEQDGAAGQGEASTARGNAAPGDTTASQGLATASQGLATDCDALATDRAAPPPGLTLLPTNKHTNKQQGEDTHETDTHETDTGPDRTRKQEKNPTRNPPARRKKKTTRSSAKKRATKKQTRTGQTNNEHDTTPEESDQVAGPPGREVDSQELRGRDQFLTLFVAQVCTAAGIPAEGWSGQQRTLKAVARHFVDRPNRKEIVHELLDLAREKKKARLDRPIAAWMTAVQKRYPETKPEKKS